MKKIIALINQKGGVAKITTALAIGTGLTKRRKNVLFVDMDAQGNLTYSVEGDPKGLNIYDLLTGEATAEQIIQHTPQGDIIPSSLYENATKSMVLADVNLAGNGMEYRLKRWLAPILDRYDHIIIDTPPALGLLTVNASKDYSNLIEN